MVRNNKPDPEGVLQGSALLRLPPSSLAMFGDHVHDALGSKKIGARFGGAAWCPRVDPQGFTAAGADWVFTSVPELAAWASGTFGAPAGE